MRKGGSLYGMFRLVSIVSLWKKEGRKKKKKRIMIPHGARDWWPLHGSMVNGDGGG